MKLALINTVWEGAEKCQNCGIRHLVLFADLNQDDFNLIHLPIDDYELEVSETLYKESMRPQFIYTIRSGLVKLVHFLPDGNYRIIRLLKQGDVGGIEALNGTPYLHHAIALQKTSVCRIPVNEVERLNRESPRLHKKLTARWQQALSDADFWLAHLTVGPAKKRVANLLLYLGKSSDFAGNQTFLLGREDMGALLGITTETASRVVAEFKRAHIIRPTPDLHCAYIDIDKLKADC
jgi:CRP-like cAMP-binding protein